MTEIRDQIESSLGSDLTLGEAKEHVETLLRRLLAEHKIYDYAVAYDIATPNATQVEVAVKPSSEEHFVYFPIRIE